MADGTPVTAETLADRTGLAVAYLRPWLANQAAGGYVTHTHVDDDDGDGEEGTDRYALSPEQAAALADPDSPAYFAPSMQVAVGALRDVDAIAERFRTGDGFGWHEHDAGLFVGTERFFKPGYVANLVDTWLPALHGVVPKLQAGARVADVGCGHAASTVLMAAAYPALHLRRRRLPRTSIVVARRRAEEAGVTDNTTFVTVDALDLAGDGYDLVTYLRLPPRHGRPRRRRPPDPRLPHPRRRVHARRTPSRRPRRGQPQPPRPRLLQRLHPHLHPQLARPTRTSRHRHPSGPATITTVLHQAGFRTVRIAAETPVNHVYEARADPDSGSTFDLRRGPAPRNGSRSAGERSTTRSAPVHRDRRIRAPGMCTPGARLRQPKGTNDVQQRRRPTPFPGRRPVGPGRTRVEGRRGRGRLVG